MGQHGGNSQLGSLAVGCGELGGVARDPGAGWALTTGVGEGRRAAAADGRDATRGRARRGRVRVAGCRRVRGW